MTNMTQQFAGFIYEMGQELKEGISFEDAQIHGYIYLGNKYGDNFDNIKEFSKWIFYCSETEFWDAYHEVAPEQSKLDVR